MKLSKKIITKRERKETDKKREREKKREKHMLTLGLTG